LSALFFHVFLYWERDNPLSSFSVANVFPLRSYALLEEHVVGIWHYLLNTVDVVVHSPEIFNRAKRVNLMQNVLVMTAFLSLLLLLIMTQRVNIPKGPPAH